MDRKNSLKGSMMLLLTAFIWGIAFVAQSVGINAVGCFTFNGIRNIIGGLVLIPVILVIKKKNGNEKMLTKDALVGGICCGICLFAAGTFQQWGILESSVGKASFITALYVVIVPVMGIFMGKKAGIRIWLSVAVAVVGMYFLCIKDGFTIERGDVFLFIGAVLFSVHILVIDHFSPKANGVVISCVQFFVAGILSLTCMAFTESPSLSDILNAWLPIIYAGCLSCGVAYTLQVVYQKDVEPAAASLILSLESVFGALGGWVILGQSLSVREIAGCVLVFVAIIMAQMQ